MQPHKPLEIVYSPINAAQREVKKHWDKTKLLILEGVAGSGKAQPLDSIVMTPSGPKQMGFISVGEEVLTTNGVTTVRAIYPQGVKQVYTVHFSDGSLVKCCGDHLWEVTVNGKKKVMKLDDIRENLSNSRYSIEAPEAAQFSDNHLQVIDPYVMGYILAKGTICTSGVTVLEIYNKATREKLQGRLPQNYKLRPLSNRYKYILECLTPDEDNITEFIKMLNLGGLGAHELFIPVDYLYASIQQRLQLLNGLMDGDGGCDRGHAEFYTSSPALKSGVAFLVQSLGGLCKTRARKVHHKDTEGNVVCTRFTSYTIRIRTKFNPFTLSKKASQYTVKKKPLFKTITDVISSAYEECQCISLNGDNKLYLTDEFTPTHNTSAALAHSLIDLQKGKIDKVLLCRPTVAVEEELGHLPGDVKEKLAPWMGSFVDVLGDISHLRGLDTLPVELVAAGMLRGRTVKKAILIVDEAQNLTASQLKCIVTRVGDKGKVILCGDPTQSDLQYSPNPFHEIALKLAVVKGCHLIKFTKEDQVREPFINDILEVLEGWV